VACCGGTNGLDDEVGVEVKFVEEEVVEGLAGHGRRQRTGWKVREVVGDDHVGSAGHGGGDHVPVVGVREYDGRHEPFPAGHGRIREGDPHLPEEAGEVGVGFLW
jgi:hypothetical protein